MKSKLLIAGIVMLVFGLINFFRYMPISYSPTFLNKPFPFEHLYNVIPSDGKGIHRQIIYLPFDAIINDPYWLIWSLLLYAGVVIVVYSIWRQRK